MKCGVNLAFVCSRLDRPLWMSFFQLQTHRNLHRLRTGGRLDPLLRIVLSTESSCAVLADGVAAAADVYFFGCDTAASCVNVTHGRGL